MYDADRPFFTDKQPPMQMPLLGGYESIPSVPAHHGSFCHSQPALPPASLDVCHAQDSLPLPVQADVNVHQQGSFAQDYYPEQLSKQLPQYPHQPALMMTAVQGANHAPIPYGPNPLVISSSPPLPPHDTVSPDGLCQYTLAPDGNLVETVSPDGWDAPLYDQQAGFDILLPNQRGGKRGPFKDPSLREQTAQTRKMGSCIRCRMQRIRVSVLPIKLKCQKLSGCVTSDRHRSLRIRD